MQLDDNIYPNDGSVVDNSLPEERIKEEQEEQTDAYKSAPVYNKLLIEFNRAIDFYSSVESLDIKDDTSETEVKALVLASKKMVAFLKIQKEGIEGMAAKVK